MDVPMSRAGVHIQKKNIYKYVYIVNEYSVNIYVYNW